jgi:hypothetical protein
MKATIDIPNSTYEQAKTLAGAQGISVEKLLANTVQEKLGGPSFPDRVAAPPWMKGFGALADLKEESARIMKSIEEEFEQVEPEDRQ